MSEDKIFCCERGVEVFVNLTLIASTGTNRLVTNILEVKAESNVARLLWKFVIFLELPFY